jgi:anaerobic ribonucleoside-triphosphate reductase activating protein
MVIWFQGCSLGCPHCFNPETHHTEPAQLFSVEELARCVYGSQATVEGITISGGEPLQQPEGLLLLLKKIRASTSLSIILFSGYTLEEINRFPIGPDVLKHVDCLIAGRYAHKQRVACGLRGSSNQTIHLLTGRYCLSELEKTPPTEIRIVTGVLPITFRDGPMKREI